LERALESGGAGFALHRGWTYSATTSHRHQYHYLLRSADF
jgi:hypothetical protein